MTKIGKYIFGLALVLLMSPWMAEQFLRPTLEAWLSRFTGTHVEFSRVALLLTRHGPAVKFSDVILRDPESTQVERARVLYLAFSPLPVSHLHLEVVGLQTRVQDHATKVVTNPIWESLIRELTKPSAMDGFIKTWRLVFKESLIHLDLSSGQTVSVRPEIIHDPNTNELVIQGRLEDDMASTVECRLALGSNGGEFHVCHTSRLSAATLRKYLENSQIIRPETRRILRQSALAGQLKDAEFVLRRSEFTGNGETGGGFQFRAHLHDVSVAPIADLPAFRNVEGTIQVNPETGHVELASPNLVMVTKARSTAVKTTGRVNWSHNGNSLYLRISQFAASTPLIDLKGIEGGVAIDRDAWRLTGFKGLLFDSRLFATGGQNAGKTQLRLNTRLSPEVVSRLLGIDLSPGIEGDIPFAGEFRMTPKSERTTESLWRLRADFADVAIRLPAPFAKPRQTPAHLEIEAVESASASADAPVSVRGTYSAPNLKVSYNSTRDLQLQTKMPSLDVRTLLKWWHEINKRSVFSASRPSSVTRLTPALIPTMRLVVDELIYDGRPLGRLLVELDRSNEGLDTRLSARRMSIEGGVTRLQITSASWTSSSTGGQHTRVGGWAESADVADLYETLGLAKKFERLPVRVGFDLSWPGLPYDPRLEGVDGRIGIEFGKGRVLSASPLLQKALNLASIDIKNLFKSGIPVQRGRAEFAISMGRVRTVGSDANLNMRLAHFRFSGEADLTTMKVDGRMRVTPLVAGSVFNLALLAFVPPAGIAVWALEYQEHSLFNRLKTHQYKLVDSLLDPRVKFDGF